VSSLLIFDCDGVLVDSEPLANQVLHGHIRELGIEVSLEESTRTFTGLSMGACVGLIEEMLGGNVPDNFVSRLRIHTARVFADGLRPVTGIETILPGVDGPLCVASSGSSSGDRYRDHLAGSRRSAMRGLEREPCEDTPQSEIDRTSSLVSGRCHLQRRGRSAWQARSRSVPPCG
jgi:beta-phosphoglucomutase-like phosphatase (HAD superfamily)